MLDTFGPETKRAWQRIGSSLSFFALIFFMVLWMSRFKYFWFLMKANVL